MSSNNHKVHRYTFIIKVFIDVAKLPLGQFWAGAKIIIWLYLSNYTTDFYKICNKDASCAKEDLIKMLDVNDNSLSLYVYLSIYFFI